MRLVVMSFLAGCSYSPPPGAVIDSSPGDGVEADTPPGDAPEGAWLVGWSHRKSIDIDDDEVRGDLANFPVLIRFPADPEIADIALPDGSDLAVTGADATARLEIDLESYEAGAVVLWVKVPVLDDDTDTRLYLYYGNAAPPSHDSTQVWTNQFLASWHLNQNPETPAAGTLVDATGAHGATPDNSFSAGDLVVAQVDKGIRFDNVIDKIDVPSAVNLGQQFTISAWVRLANQSGIKTIFSNSLSGLPVPGCRLFVNTDATADRMLRFETSNGDNQNTLTATTDAGRIPDGQFAHVAVVADRAAGSAKLYVDGIDLTSSTASAILTNFQNTTSSVFLGRMGDLFSWRGLLDQLEIASEARSPAWIETAVRNQRTGSTFLTLGEQESDPN